MVLNRASVTYLTGFTGSAGVFLLSASDGAILVTDGRYKEQAGLQTKGLPLKMHIERDYVRAVGNCLTGLGWKRIGFEDRHCTVAFYQGVKDRLGTKRVRFVGASDLMTEIRSLKDEEELQALKKSAEIVDKALEKTLSEVRAGITEKELAWELESHLRALGSEGVAFAPIVLFGERTSLPHGQPSDRALKKGDWLLLDCGAVWHGYASDITRTFFFGRPQSEDRHIYKAVWEAQQAGLAALREGVIGQFVDRTVRKVLRSYGLEKFFLHGTGHGVGLEIHEAPGLNKTAHQKLRSGMVVTVEPGVYIGGSGGVRIEDMAVVTEDGCRLLTQSPNPPQLPVL